MCLTLSVCKSTVPNLSTAGATFLLAGLKTLLAGARILTAGQRILLAGVSFLLAGLKTLLVGATILNAGLKIPIGSAKVRYPPYIRQIFIISAIYPPVFNLYDVPFFSPSFTKIFNSVRFSKSLNAVLSEVSFNS